MANALPVDLIIDITSTGVRDTFTIGKLNTLIIQKYSETLPNDAFDVVYSKDIAAKRYGYNSSVAGFARVYFGIKSKSATICEQLFIYNWNKDDTPAVLKGGKAPALSKLKTLNGKFKITIGATTKDVTVDLTNATDFTNAATILKTAITNGGSFAGAEVSFNADTGGFIVKGGTKGQGETIAYLAAASSGTDIHDKLGLTQAEGASVIVGRAGVPTLAEALDEISNNNGNYYVITPNFDFDDVPSDLLTFGQFIHDSNDRFLGIYSWSNPALEVLDSGATAPYQAFNGLLIDDKKQDFQNAYIAGLISAMDLTKANGNYNVAFNDATQFKVEAITDRAKYEGLVSNKANAPCKFGILGQDDTIYMDGTIMGDKTTSANVYLCNSFLKFNQQIALYNMFKAQKLIALRGQFGKAIIRSYLDEVFRNAVNANIIVKDTLTNTEKQAVIAEFSPIVKDIERVIEQIEANGYYYEFSGLDTVKRELYITEVYIANVPVKRIVMNTYILGA